MEFVKELYLSSNYGLYLLVLGCIQFASIVGVRVLSYIMWKSRSERTDAKVIAYSIVDKRSEEKKLNSDYMKDKMYKSVILKVLFKDVTGNEYESYVNAGSKEYTGNVSIYYDRKHVKNRVRFRNDVNMFSFTVNTISLFICSILGEISVFKFSVKYLTESNIVNVIIFGLLGLWFYVSIFKSIYANSISWYKSNRHSFYKGKQTVL